MAKWLHNDQERRWEFGYHDVLRDHWVPTGCVTDDAILRVPNPAVLAVRAFTMFGSVPPPLKAHLITEPADG